MGGSKCLLHYLSFLMGVRRFSLWYASLSGGNTILLACFDKVWSY